MNNIKSLSSAKKLDDLKGINDNFVNFYKSLEVNYQ